MRLLDYIVIVTMTIILIVGVYQFYFWCQRNMLRSPVSLETKIDSWFGYRPEWVWIYSGLYYPAIVSVIACVSDARHYVYVAFSYFVLLFVQMAIFIIFPVSVPQDWRDLVGEKYFSERFLRFIQTFDGRSNCFPSMHVSVATLTALHIKAGNPLADPWILVFPALIAVSAVYTKQHFILDLPPGAMLGWLVFLVFDAIY